MAGAPHFAPIYDTDLLSSTPLAVVDPLNARISALGLAIETYTPCEATLSFRFAVDGQKFGRCLEIKDFLRAQYGGGSSDVYRLYQHSLLLDRGRRLALLVKRGDSEGNGYKDRALVVAAPYASDAAAGAPLAIYADEPISERHEPFFLLPQSGDGQRVISLAARSGKTKALTDTPDASTGDTVAVLERTLGDVTAREWSEATLSVQSETIPLSSDWIQRPALLVREPRDGATALFFSRAHAFPAADGLDGYEDKVAVEILSAQRSADAVWRLGAGARCSVTYRLNKQSGGNACFQRHSDAMDTALVRFPGGQTLVGDIDKSGALDVVLADPCMPTFPIILKANRDGSFDPVASVATGVHLERRVSCERLDARQRASAPIAAR